MRPSLTAGAQWSCASVSTVTEAGERWSPTSLPCAHNRWCYRLRQLDGAWGEKEKGLQIGLKMFRVNCERELKEVGLKWWLAA